MKDDKSDPILTLAVVVSTLGYFVDIFDLFLFSVLRVSSLKDLGVPSDQLMEVGVTLLNRQMLGVLFGGVFWGVLGDRIGRVQVLFASIILYSLANIANGFVHSVELYGWLRLISGFGLAGELGLAITLVSETLSQKNRGYGTTIVATVGLCGSIVAAWVAQAIHWRNAFILGGILGLVLLLLRIKIKESSLFEEAKVHGVERGNFFMLFHRRERGWKYLRLIMVGVPIWFSMGIMITFAPEFARELGVIGTVTTGDAVFYTYIGVALGDLGTGFWSQQARNRKRIIAASILFLAIFSVVFLFSRQVSVSYFYWVCVGMGIGTGYWAVLMTMAAEQFGTNLRSTASTSIPNFVRGSVVPITLLFQYLKPSFGLVQSVAILGVSCFGLALWALSKLPESYGKDLSFNELQ